MSSSHSALTYLGLLLTVVPALYAWFLCGTIDSWPRWVCLGVGVTVGAALAYFRFMRGAKAYEEMMAEHYAKHGVGESAPPPPPRPGSGGLGALLWGLGPPCWFVAIALLGNRFLDTAEPTRHEVKLLRVEDRYKGKDLIHLSSWRKGEKRIVVSKDDMRMPQIHLGVPAGSPVVVQTKPGAFGWPWIVRIDPK